MKVSLNWLQDYVNTGAKPDALAHRLTMAGLEVEQVSSVGGDTVFEFEITPNRADCLSVFGIAREASAVFNKPKKAAGVSKIVFPKTGCDINIEDKKGCTRYSGTLIEGIKVGKTTDFIKKRIGALGMRGVNNVVDITNFVLMETGQPLHAFDYDKLAGGKIIVRQAKKGEKITAIDGEEYKLDPSMLVIADAKRAVAIAGVMGGKDTEVTSKTKNILLESAYFDPISVRQTSRKLGLTSDSSYRFERGVDYEGVDLAARRATSLILEGAKGTVTAKSDVQATKTKKKSPSIRIRVSDINDSLGAKITAAQCTNILKKLDFDVKKSGKNALNVAPPSFRNDIKNVVDLTEEVARIVGYDNLPSSLPFVKACDIESDNTYKMRESIRGTLQAEGFNEIITYSMVNQKALSDAGLRGLKGVTIQNPLSQDQEMMRPSLLPSLLAVLRHNYNRGIKHLKTFELGRAYDAKEEQEVLAVACMGKIPLGQTRGYPEEFEFYHVKGAVCRALERIGIRGIGFVDAKASYLESGKAANIVVFDQEIGTIGKIKEDVLKNYDIKEKSVVVAQLHLKEIYKKADLKRAFKAFSEYPGIVRDISLTIARTHQYHHIVDAIEKLKVENLQQINFTEQYAGKEIPKNRRALVLSLTYQSHDRTLTEEEINPAHQKILKSLEGKLQVVIR